MSYCSRTSWWGIGRSKKTLFSVYPVHTSLWMKIRHRFPSWKEIFVILSHILLPLVPRMAQLLTGCGCFCRGFQRDVLCGDPHHAGHTLVF